MPDQGSPFQAGAGSDDVLATFTVTGELDLATAPRLTDHPGHGAASLRRRRPGPGGGRMFAEAAGCQAARPAHRAVAEMCPVCPGSWPQPRFPR